MREGRLTPLFWLMIKYKNQFFSKHDKKLLPAIRKAVIGIAGAGGLGSNVAVSLARVGIGKLIFCDFDCVEITNLNRQQFFFKQLGDPKVEALKENLENINPFSEYEIHDLKLDPENIRDIYRDVDVMIEAFDLADQKQMLIETWLKQFPDKPIIAASGLAGFGNNELIHTRKVDNLYIIGDEESELLEHVSPMAPRVAIVANMQANLALELILSSKII